MQSWSIFQRLSTGFFAATVLVILTSAFVYNAISTLGDGYKTFRNTSKQSIAFHELLDGLFEARVAAYQFRNLPNPETEQNAMARVADLRAALDDLGAVADDPGTADTLVDIRSELSAYSGDLELFSELTAGLKEIEKMRLEIGRAARVNLTQVRNSASRADDAQMLLLSSKAEECILLGRIYFAEFAQSRDPVHVDEAAQHLTDASTYLLQAETYLSHSTDLGLQIAVEPLLGETRALLSELIAMGPKSKDLTAQVIEVTSGSLDEIEPRLQEKFENIASSIAAEQDKFGAQGQSIVDRMQWLAPISGIIATLMSVLTGLLVARWIIRPVRDLVKTTTELAAGNTDIVVSGTEYDHELGKLARALEVFRKAHIEREDVAAKRAQDARAEQRAVVAALSHGLERLAAGDLATQVEEAFPPEYEPLRNNFNSAVTTLRLAISSVVETTHTIERSASQINSGAADLSQRTENQAATLEEAAAALEQLTESVNSSAQRTVQVERAIELAREDAKQSGDVVSRAVEAMGTIQSSSEQISQITDLISDIAFQTNLLALNAGIEAARAGDAGSGFAVVASEIGSLAHRSSQAAQEVNALITTSTQKVSQGTSLVNGAGGALRDIILRVEQVTDLVSDIAQSSYEQASGISEINIGISQLDTVTQKNAGLVVSSGQHGAELAKHAGALAMLIENFQLGTSQPDLRDIPPLRQAG